MGIIYCYTNKNTGKKYIGQTIHPEQRKRSHLYEATNHKTEYYFHRSIRKHGWEAFEYEVLETVDEEHLSERETFYIKSLNTHWPNGYNELIDHIGMPDSVRKKISETKKARWANESEETKRKSIEKAVQSNIGRKHSVDTNKKKSESMKAFLKKNPRIRKPWTQEMKDKQSAKLKEKYAQGIGRWANRINTQ